MANFRGSNLPFSRFSIADRKGPANTFFRVSAIAFSIWARNSFLFGILSLESFGAQALLASIERVKSKISPLSFGVFFVTLKAL